MEEASEIANDNPQYLAHCTVSKEGAASVSAINNTNVDVGDD